MLSEQYVSSDGSTLPHTLTNYDSPSAKNFALVHFRSNQPVLLRIHECAIQENVSEDPALRLAKSLNTYCTCRVVALWWSADSALVVCLLNPTIRKTFRLRNRLFIALKFGKHSFDLEQLPITDSFSSS